MCRIAQNITQEQLAEKAGVSVATIKRYECGTYNGVQLFVANNIATALGVPLQVLLSSEGETDMFSILEILEAIRAVKEKLNSLDI